MELGVHAVVLWVRKPLLIIVQRNATQNSLFIILQDHSTRFGFQPHPSSGVHKTVNTATGTGHTTKNKGI